MSLLFETISIRNGYPENLAWHQQRLDNAMKEYFKVKPILNLDEVLEIPSQYSIGHVRCRIEYDTTIRNIIFSNYAVKQVKSLKLLEDNNIDYNFKFTDRSRLDLLFSRRGNCDDVLIVKNGFITDSSYANIIFRKENHWETPDTSLLSGTCRARLLAAGVILKARITPYDLKKYSEFRLINAMRGFDTGEAVPVESIRF